VWPEELDQQTGSSETLSKLTSAVSIIIIYSYETLVKLQCSVSYIQNV
jgi:hypothetical protein